MTLEPPRPRRPVEAIKPHTITSADCESRVRKTLTKLVETGAPYHRRRRLHSRRSWQDLRMRRAPF